MNPASTNRPTLLAMCLVVCSLAGCIREVGGSSAADRVPLPQTLDVERSSGPPSVAALEAPCAASIDLVNGVAVSPSTILARTLPVTISGWSAHDLAAGDANDSIFVALVDRRDGGERLFATRKNPRDDVKVYIGHPDMPDLGYESTLRIDGLRPGPYRLLLYTGWAGELIRCSTPNVELTIGP